MPPLSSAHGFRLARFLPYRLSVIAEQVSRLVARTYADRFALSTPEWRVIAHLGYSTSLSALTIAERTAMDKVKVSRALARLTDRGIVRREVNPLDQRGALLALTPPGRALYEQIVPAALETERGILAALDPADLAHLERILGLLETHVAELCDAQTAPKSPLEAQG